MSPSKGSVTSVLSPNHYNPAIHPESPSSHRSSRSRSNRGTTDKSFSSSSSSQRLSLVQVTPDGDYQVLRTSVEHHRRTVQEGRVDLAEKLDLLGEHHVRRKEYDQAMDAFTEALREKRSVFWNIGNCNMHNLPALESTTTRTTCDDGPATTANENASVFSSSYLSGLSAGKNTNGNGNGNGPSARIRATSDDNIFANIDHDYTTTVRMAEDGDKPHPPASDSSPPQSDSTDHVKLHDDTIDALVHTLRNMGNVHSLRGEQDEAMRYFTEVTTLRNQKLASEYVTACQDADDASVETRSFLSGFSAGGNVSAFSAGSAANNGGPAITPPPAGSTTMITDDTSTSRMSEFNEDVRALDDLFRDISFRKGGEHVRTESSATTSLLSSCRSPAAGSSSDAKRKSSSSRRRSKKHKHGGSPSSRGRHPGTASRRSSYNQLRVDTDLPPSMRRNSTHGAGNSSGSSVHVPSTPSNTKTCSSSAYASSSSRAAASSRSTATQSEVFLSSLTTGRSGISSAAQQALDKYRRALESYTTTQADPKVQQHDPKWRQHQERINSLALRVELLPSKRSNTSSTAGSGATRPTTTTTTDTTTSNTAQPAPEEQILELELALDIYRSVLVAHRELSSTASDDDLHQHVSIPFTVSSSSSSSSLGSSTESSSSSLSRSPNSSTTQASRRPRRHELASQMASTLICIGQVSYRLGQRDAELDAYRRAKAVYATAFGHQHVFVAGTRKNMGMCLAEAGHYDQAQRQFELAMAIYLRHANSSNTNTNSNTANTNSNTMNDNQDTAPNEETNLNAGRNRDVASILSCIGNVKNRIGELDAALTRYVQALQVYKSLYTHARQTHPVDDIRRIEALRDVSSTLKVIGMVHAKQGEYDDALTFFVEALDLLQHHEQQQTTAAAALQNSAEEETADDSSTQSSSSSSLTAAKVAAEKGLQETTASVLTRIASIHLKKGHLDDAMTAYRHAYDITVQTRGNTTNHPEIAGILHYIGGIYHKRSEYDEAMACYQESIRIYHSTLGSEHPTVAGTLVMVGSIHYKRRQLDQAMMFYREALRLNREAYGMHHPDVAPILKSIGTILTKKGEYHAAYDIFRDVLSVKVTVYGTDHAEVASAYKSLGNVHYKLQELADAERQYRHALSIYRRCKGDDHPDTISAKTTIEHLRYWMRERDQRREQELTQQRRQDDDHNNDERSC